MSDIIIHEVGPRDGLQVEKAVVPKDVKLGWIRALIAAGVDIVQVGSFVHPEKVPQMADTDELFRILSAEKNRRTVLSGLVLNEKGLERGLACGVEMFCLGVSASETHSRKNTGMGSREAQDRIIATAKQAALADKRVQVSVQSAFGCGFEGPVPEERVLEIVRAYLEAGLKSVSLADTAGHAYPEQVQRLFGKLRELAPDIQCTCHFHDTYGLGMANIYAALESSVVSFETSFGLA
jgi:hydroxymethylglutaryl-CoA lyase